MQKILLMQLITLLFFGANNIYSQPNHYVDKKAGICFRVDDNHKTDEFLDFANVFNNHDLNFTFALNLGREQFSSDYIDMIKDLQSDGHEMMDHTPTHNTNYFWTNLGTDYYIGHPGVHKINGTTIQLKHEEVDISNAKRTGTVNVNGNLVTSSEGIFSGFSKNDCYLYFPSLDTLVYIDAKTGWIDANNIEIRDVWRDGINLGNHESIQFYNFDFSNVHLTIDALKALAEETLRLADHYGIERPKTWIQPGGYHPRAHKDELKNALGDNLEYKAGAVYPSASLKVFNEYNPNSDKAFGMQWGDFKLYSTSLEEVKKIIADKIAKNRVLIGSSHFRNLINNDWNEYLNRVDGLLQWCFENDIPVRTYTEWADILYNRKPNPYQNVFPKLNVDLDENSIPDGFTNKEGTWLKNDGVEYSNYHSYSIDKKGDICFIDDLGGIEKGENQFEIWTKGAEGNFIEVVFKVGSYNHIFKFPAESLEWQKYDLSQSINGNTSLNIPEWVSLIDITIRCSDHSSGNVKISGMSLSKLNQIDDYLIINPSQLNFDSGNANQYVVINSNINWSVENNYEWINLDKTEGLGDDSVIVTINKNENVTERKGTIYFISDSIIDSVIITQKGLAVYSITALPDTADGGIVFGSGEYAEGSIVELIAVPNSGWKFKEWLEDSVTVSIDSIYNFTATYSRIIVAIFQSLTTNINSDKIIPLEFRLSQNYPNPFNPASTIIFDLAEDSFVNLTFYNIMGEVIHLAIDDFYPMGSYKYIIDATNLSSGVYFYSIIAKGLSGKSYSMTKKMTILR